MRRWSLKIILAEHSGCAFVQFVTSLHIQHTFVRKLQDCRTGHFMSAAIFLNYIVLLPFPLPATSLSASNHIVLLPVATIPWSNHGSSASELDPPSPCLAAGCPRDLDVPAPYASPTVSGLPEKPLDGKCSPPRAPSADPCIPPRVACGGPASIPLHPPPTTNSMSPQDSHSAIRVILNCIDICVVMVTMFIASMEASEAYTARRKQKRRRNEGDVSSASHNSLRHYEPQEDASEVPHVKQICDLVAWHIGDDDARWYVKPRSTCWFEEYLFNIYTPDMFYDILCMRRRTFDRLF